MTREEIKKIIGGIIVSYPNYKPQDMSMTVQMWEMMLGEYDYRTVTMALKSYITTDTSGFAPSIGQIIEKIRLINRKNDEQLLTEAEAWSLVSKALRNSTYHSKEEFDKLPELVQKAVGSHEMLSVWAKDENYNENVVSSNFMRSYRAIVKRQEEYMALPTDVRQAIETAAVKQIGGE